MMAYAAASPGEQSMRDHRWTQFSTPHDAPGDVVRTYEVFHCKPDMLTLHPAQIAKRYEPFLSFVSDRERRASQTPEEGHPKLITFAPHRP
jgi:hypothetical protein